MTAVLPITLAPANATAVSGSATPSPAAALAGIGRLLAPVAGWLRAQLVPAPEVRLGGFLKRDIGLLPEQELDGVFRERDDLLWRV